MREVSVSTQKSHDERIDAFVKRLADLNAAERARLKRNAGLSLAESRDVLGLFYRLLPATVPEWQHEQYFLVATLYPLAKGTDKGDLGSMLRAARSPSNGAGLDRRMEVLLDASRDELRFRLRQAIHYANSQRVRVNWAALLDHLLLWDRSDRLVQKKWASSYFGQISSSAS